MNFIKKLIGTSTKEELAVIPGGQFYLTRSPQSPKGANECLFNDAIATIRKTSIEYNYQLVIQRVYDEGEEDLEDDHDVSGLEDEDKDEWAFLLDEALRLSYKSKDNKVVISWKDQSGEEGDTFEFVCDEDIKPKVFDQFETTAMKCQYERKYSSEFTGTDQDLAEFDFNVDDSEEAFGAVEHAVEPTVEPPIIRPTTVKSTAVDSTEQFTVPDEHSTAPPIEHPNTQSVQISTETPSTPVESPASGSASPPVAEPAREGEILTNEKCSLHLFDAPSGQFVEQAEQVTAKVLDTGDFEYWLEVVHEDKPLLALALSSEINPCFNYEHLAFIFNYFSSEGAFSWLLRFPSFEDLEKFQQGFMQAMWEGSNKVKWAKARVSEQEYLADAFGQLQVDEDMEDVGDDGSEDEFHDDETERKPQEEEYDVDEEQDDVDTFSGQGKNSQLAVGTFNDRSYVVRGDKIGVFKQTKADDLEFTTTIDKVTNMEGRTFQPTKVMLHTEDRALVLQDGESLNKLFKMDLEYGKVVEEWQVDPYTQVAAYAPDAKFAQRTGEQTFIGISGNGLFRIDPRLSGDKIVENESKKFFTKNQFSSVATTETGHIAVASAKGDIRLYDRLGINAKTQLPALGDAIIGVDVSADGKWVLATCKTYLLLIDTTIKEGKNAGSSGFVKSFGKDSKPRPKRLQISPEHVAYMQGETCKPLHFTTAHFNIGEDVKENQLVTSSGPYVISWSLHKVLRGDKEPYLIKRYGANVTADNFAYGTNKNVIVSLEDDVGMVNRRSFRKPTRESLATPARRVKALSRNSIVNSPF